MILVLAGEELEMWLLGTWQSNKRQIPAAAEDIIPTREDGHGAIVIGEVGEALD